jgi:putative mRNA 3-end processing factor
MRYTLRINKHGGLIIGQNLIVDGHEDGLIRIVTHIHSDHTRYMLRSIKRSPLIVGTPITIDWLKALGYELHNKRQVKALDFKKRLKLDEGLLYFEKAYHIPGTAQVVFEDLEGTRVVYTSDFKKPGSATPIINADVLVTDAVYGNPAFRRDFDDYIDILLVDFIKERLAYGPVFVHGYYGKIQEVIELLRREGISAPFILDYKQYKLTQMLEKYNGPIKDYFLNGTDEANEIKRDGWYVYFTHFFKKGLNGLGSHIKLSGWEFKRPIRQLDHNWWLVAFSDHADFDGLTMYIRMARPKLVFVNSIRSTDGDLFAEYVRKKIGIKAYLLP